MGRDNVGVRPSAILDAVKNPNEVLTKIDGLGRMAQVFLGKGATVVLNSAGKVVTTWATSSEYWRIQVK